MKRKADITPWRPGDQLLKELRRIWQEITHTITYIRQPQKLSISSLDYDHYWRVRGPHTFQPRYRIIAEVVEPDATVLDIGCGEGLLLQYLSEVKGIVGYGIDVSEEAVRLAQARGVQAEVADIFHWDATQDYDYIILSEVLEHLPNPEEVVIKVRNRFRKALLVSIPNIGYYPHRLRLLLGRFPIQWGWHPAEHLRFWTVLDFVEWIQELGLTVADVRPSNGFPGLYRLWPNLFGNQVVFVIHAGQRPTNQERLAYETVSSPSR